MPSLYPPAKLFVGHFSSHMSFPCLELAISEQMGGCHRRRVAGWGRSAELAPPNGAQLGDTLGQNRMSMSPDGDDNEGNSEGGSASVVGACFAGTLRLNLLSKDFK